MLESFCAFYKGGILGQYIYENLLAFECEQLLKKATHTGLYLDNGTIYVISAAIFGFKLNNQNVVEMNTVSFS